jgi:hypothetical protein
MYDGTGIGSNAKILTDPLLIKPSTRLQLGLLFGSNSPWYFALIGRKVYGVTDSEWFEINKKQWYSYVAKVPTLTKGNQSFLVQTQIFSQADFVLKKIFASEFVFAVYRQSQSSGVSINPIFNVRFTSLDKNLQNKMVSVLINAGQMQTITYNDPTISGLSTPSFARGFDVNPPFRIPRNSIIEIRISNPNLTTDLVPAIGTYTPITFEGVHVYD